MIMFDLRKQIEYILFPGSNGPIYFQFKVHGVIYHRSFI